MMAEIFASRGQFTNRGKAKAKAPTEAETDADQVTPRTSCKSLVTRAISAAIDNLPSWLDPKKTQASMIVRKKRPSSQVNRDDFEAKAKKRYYGNRYSSAFKEATKKLVALREDPSKWGVRGYGVRSVIKQVTQEMLTSPNDRKLHPNSILNALSENHVGVSPFNMVGDLKFHLSCLWLLLSTQQCCRHRGKERHPVQGWNA